MYRTRHADTASGTPSRGAPFGSAPMEDLGEPRPRGPVPVGPVPIGPPGWLPSMHARHCRRANDPMLDAGDLRDLTMRFRAARLEYGTVVADARWVDAPFGDWLDILDGVAAVRGDGGGPESRCDGCRSADCGAGDDADDDIGGDAGCGDADCDDAVCGGAGRDDAGRNDADDSDVDCGDSGCDDSGCGGSGRGGSGCGGAGDAGRAGRAGDAPIKFIESPDGFADAPGAGEAAAYCRCPLCCPPLSRDSVAAFAVGMHEALSIRDAVILSLVAGRGCDKPLMVAFAADPHAERSRARMGAMLSQAFENAESVPDCVRCGRGIGMLLRIASLVPERLRLQPFAVISYVLWWLDDDRSSAYAWRCLDLDGGCLLASMVLGMLERGVRPAWCR